MTMNQSTNIPRKLLAMCLWLVLVLLSCDTPAAGPPGPDGGGAAERPYDLPDGVVLIDTIRPPAGFSFLGTPIHFLGTIYVVSAANPLNGGNYTQIAINAYDADGLSLIGSVPLPEPTAFSYSNEMQLAGDRLFVTGITGVLAFSVSGGSIPTLLWSARGSAHRTGSDPGTATVSTSDNRLYAVLPPAQVASYDLATGERTIVANLPDNVCPGSGVRITNVTPDPDRPGVIYFTHGDWCERDKFLYADLYAWDVNARKALWKLPSAGWQDSIYGVSPGLSPHVLYGGVMAAINGRSIVGVDVVTGLVLWKRSSLGGAPLDMSIGYTLPDSRGRALFADNGTGPVGVVDIATGTELWGSVGVLRRNMEASLPYGETGDFIYASSGGNTTYRVDGSTGEVKWRLDSPLKDREDVLVFAPAIVGNELYMHDLRQLYRFRLTD